MNKLTYIFICFLFICCKEQPNKEAKSCECVNTDGVQVSIPSDIPKEEVPGICSQLGGKARNCS